MFVYLVLSINTTLHTLSCFRMHRSLFLDNWSFSYICMVYIFYCIFHKYFEASFLKMMNNFLVCVMCVNNSLKHFLPNNVKTRVYYKGQKLCAKFLIKDKTSKFEWMLDNIRIEKIISTPVWATNFFGGFSSTRY